MMFKRERKWLRVKTKDFLSFTYFQKLITNRLKINYYGKNWFYIKSITCHCSTTTEVNDFTNKRKGV